MSFRYSLNPSSPSALPLICLAIVCGVFLLVAPSQSMADMSTYSLGSVDMGWTVSGVSCKTVLEVDLETGFARVDSVRVQMTGNIDSGSCIFVTQFIVAEDETALDCMSRAVWQ